MAREVIWYDIESELNKFVNNDLDAINIDKNGIQIRENRLPPLLFKNTDCPIQSVIAMHVCVNCNQSIIFV